MIHAIEANAQRRRPDIDTPTVPISSVSVAVVCICSAEHLARCLDALRRQRDAPPFDIVVARDPRVRDVEAVGERYPEARIIAHEHQRTPLELASRALLEARGELVLLTEDHCVPAPDWVRRLLDAQDEGRAAVGGRVETAAGVSATDWAFYFVDFFRYAAPLRGGPSPSLTVCNVAYRRRHLQAIAELWRDQFHETAVNDALRRRFGPLWLDAGAAVTMRRHVALGDALYERYSFGRLFGCTRIGFAPPGKRLLWALFAPGLPVLLLARMAAKAARSPRLLRSFARALPPLALMVLWWSWGEWLGYLTGRLPRSTAVAPEARTARRQDGAGSASRS